MVGDRRRAELRQLALDAGVRRRFVPISSATRTPWNSRARALRSTSCRRQLGHTDLGTTSAYVQGIDPSEITHAVRSRRPPTISATAGLAL